MGWRRRLESEWYGGGPWATALRPLGSLYCGVAAIRRRWIKGQIAPIPTLVLGNLVVGGSAKTPTAMALAQHLRDCGWHPALISRGYGAHPHHEPWAVDKEDPPAIAGDEPLLLRRVAPVYIARQRLLAITAAAQAGHDIAVLDDGFQHLALTPHLRLLLLQGERPLGNGCCLPAGPLREPVAALALADACLLDEAAARSHELERYGRPAFTCMAQPVALVSLISPDHTRPLTSLAGQQVSAVTGIARPERFVCSLESLGARVQLFAFPDHHRFCPEDLLGLPGPLVMTAKDAVKCRLLSPLPDEVWVLEMGVELAPAFRDWLDHRLAPWRTHA